MAILIKQRRDLSEVKEVYADVRANDSWDNVLDQRGSLGRVLLVSFKIDNEEYIVGNFYAPSYDRNQKKSFFDHYVNVGSGFKDKNLIYVGDWNTVEDCNRDITTVQGGLINGGA